MVCSVSDLLRVERCRAVQKCAKREDPQSCQRSASILTVKNWPRYIREQAFRCFVNILRGGSWLWAPGRHHHTISPADLSRNVHGIRSCECTNRQISWFSSNCVLFGLSSFIEPITKRSKLFRTATSARRMTWFCSTLYNSPTTSQ